MFGVPESRRSRPLRSPRLVSDKPRRHGDEYNEEVDLRKRNDGWTTCRRVGRKSNVQTIGDCSEGTEEEGRSRSEGSISSDEGDTGKKGTCLKT